MTRVLTYARLFGATLTMACDNIDPRITNLLYWAYRLAGGSRTGPLEGPQAEDAIQAANFVLAGWSGSASQITYETYVEFTPTDSLFSYKVGNTPLCEVKANPFADVRTVTYNVGKLSYDATHLPQNSFDAIQQKNIVNPYIEYWNELIQQDFTIMRFWPLPTNATTIRIYGMQRLSDVTLFQSQDAIPQQNQLYFVYSVAKHLINITRGTPQANFYNDYAEIQANFQASNRNDYQYQPTSMPISLKNVGSPSIGYWNT